MKRLTSLTIQRCWKQHWPFYGSMTLLYLALSIVFESSKRASVDAATVLLLLGYGTVFISFFLLLERYTQVWRRQWMVYRALGFSLKRILGLSLAEYLTYSLFGLSLGIIATGSLRCLTGLSFQMVLELLTVTSLSFSIYLLLGAGYVSYMLRGVIYSFIL